MQVCRDLTGGEFEFVQSEGAEGRRSENRTLGCFRRNSTNGVFGGYGPKRSPSAFAEVPGVLVRPFGSLVYMIAGWPPQASQRHQTLLSYSLPWWHASKYHDQSAGKHGLL